MNKEKFNKKYTPKYSEFFSLIKDMGPDLNSRKNRFDKSDLIEQAFAEATNNKLIWKDDLGYDLEDKDGLKIEVKSMENALYSKTGILKQKTKKMKLTNTLQNSAKDKKLEKTADIFMIVDTGNENSYSAAIIDYGTVINKYSQEVSDGFTCQPPIKSLTFLVRPSELKLKLNENVERYSDVKSRIQKEYVSSFFKNIWQTYTNRLYYINNRKQGDRMLTLMMTLLIGCGEKETDSSTDTSVEESE